MSSLKLFSGYFCQKHVRQSSVDLSGGSIEKKKDVACSVKVSKIKYMEFRSAINPSILQHVNRSKSFTIHLTRLQMLNVM